MHDQGGIPFKLSVFKGKKLVKKQKAEKMSKSRPGVKVFPESKQCLIYSSGSFSPKMHDESQSGSAGNFRRWRNLLYTHGVRMIKY